MQYLRSVFYEIIGRHSVMCVLRKLKWLVDIVTSKWYQKHLYSARKISNHIHHSKYLWIFKDLLTFKNEKKLLCKSESVQGFIIFIPMLPNKKSTGKHRTSSKHQEKWRKLFRPSLLFGERDLCRSCTRSSWIFQLACCLTNAINVTFLEVCWVHLHSVYFYHVDQGSWFGFTSPVICVFVGVSLIYG